MDNQRVIIAHSWSDVGVNIQTKAVAKKLSETREVLYITQARINKTATDFNDNLKVVEWPNKRPNTLRDFLFICKKIRQFKPGILIVHFGATNICMLAAWLMGVKHRICWIHTPFEVFKFEILGKNELRKTIFLRKAVYRLASKVVVLSEFGKNDALKNIGLPEEKIVKIANGIFPSKFISDASSNIKSIRFVGRLEKIKGIDILLKAFAGIAKENNSIRLDIAGNGSYEYSLEDFIQRHGLQDRIKYHGYFSNYNDALEFISKAWCLVLPTRLDNFPTVILEALSSGTPVIASNVGGIPDIIMDGYNGILFEKENVPDLSKALKKVVNEVGYRNIIAKNAVLSFKEKFSISMHVKNVTEFVNALE